MFAIRVNNEPTTGRYMTHIKRQVPRTADLAFIRKAVNTIKEIRSQRNFADRHVVELRIDIARRIANALWNRYLRYHKGVLNPPTFFEWLLERRFMHETYLNHQFRTRLHWVYRVIVTAKEPELALFGEAVEQYGDWYYELVGVFVNQRQPDEDFTLRLAKAEVDAAEFEDKVPSVEFIEVAKPLVLAEVA